MSDDDDRERLRPGEEWRRRPGVVRQGVRFGGIGCVGCLTMVVAAVLVLVILIALATHHH